MVATYGHAGAATCVAQAADGLFVGTLGAGIVHARARSAPVRLGAMHGLPGERVRDCLISAGELIVATDTGLARFDEATQRFVTLATGRFVKLAAASQRVFAADAHGRVYERLGAKLVLRMQAKLVPSAFALSSDAKLLVLGGMVGELVVADTQRFSLQAQLAKTQDMARAEPIVSLAIASDHIAVKTVDHALRVALDAKRSITAISVSGALPAEPSAASSAQALGLLQALAADTTLPCGERISALAVHQGMLYIGGFDGGLCRFDGKRFTRVPGSRALPSEMINDLASDGSRLYIATALGLAVLESDGVMRAFVHTQCQGDLRAACPWYPSVNGVSVDAATRTPWMSDLGSLHALHFDSAPRFEHVAGSRVGSSSLTKVAARGGRVAVGSSDRGVLISRGKRYVAIDAHSGLADDWVMDVAFDSHGTLWAATCTRGVSMIDDKGRIRTLRVADGLVDDYVLSVNSIDGHMWIGTLSGVSVHDERSGRLLGKITAETGLSGNEVHDAVAFDGHIWLATDAGLVVVSEQHPNVADDVTSAQRSAPPGDVALTGRYPL